MENNFYSGKNVLVTGGTGMIGIQLVNILSKYKANVSVVSLDDPSNLPNGVKFDKLDLRNFENCTKISKKTDIVFHLAGIKGSPKMAVQKPASFITH